MVPLRGPLQAVILQCAEEVSKEGDQRKAFLLVEYVVHNHRALVDKGDVDNFFEKLASLPLVEALDKGFPVAFEPAPGHGTLYPFNRMAPHMRCDQVAMAWLPDTTLKRARGNEETRE